MLLAICVAVAVAWLARGPVAALASAITGTVLFVLFVVFSLRRYREISRLAAEVDEVLHAGRRVSLSTCREGDVAVLQNEIEKMTSQLARTTWQLEQEKGALADAMADISHQIRTPLTAMALLIPSIEHAESDTERKRLLRELEQGVDRVSWLVTSLLKMAKVDAGALSIEKRMVNVASMIASATRSLEMAFDLRGVRLEVDCAAEVSFEGDARWSAEAVQNIVKNCLEHTPAGGVVTVRAHENALATHIEICDTGCGIAEQDLPHVFERFYRGTHGANEGVAGAGSARADAVGAKAANADAVDSEVAALAQPEGFGIGLALAQSLISAQGGTISAKNAPDGGALFHIAFPKLVV